MKLSRPWQWEGLSLLIITALCVSPSLGASVNVFQYCQPWICSCYMDGIYYDAGQTWTKKGEPCITYLCHDDGTFTPDRIGVEFSDKTCKYLNETWTVGCFKYGVVFDGYEAKYRLLEGGCRAQNGDCLLVGDRVVESCDTYECQIEGTCYSLVKVVSGCSSENHGCQLLHSVWHDQCAVYQCVPNDLGSSIQLHYHEVMLWPRGYYGLLKPEAGCPNVMEETWYEGSRIHFSEGNNYYSDPYTMAGNHTETMLEHQFCLHDDELRPDFMPVYQTYWDAGRYCILRVNGTCPRNFTEGYVRMIDFNGNITVQDVDIDVEGIVDGILPDGEFNDNSTLLQFCCRYDGEIDEPLILPSGKDFVLFMAENETDCQEVRAMSWEKQFFSFADDGEGYERELVGALPRISTSDNNTMIYLCHYKRLTCGCVYENGEYVNLGGTYTTSGGCVSYNCVFSEMIKKNVLMLNSAGCYHNGGCLAEGASVEIEQGESCYSRTCVKKTDLNKNFFQDSWQLENIPSGCRNDGVCVPIDTVVNNGCFEKKCELINDEPKFRVIRGGCTSGDKCIPVGQNLTTNECVTLQCRELVEEKRTDLVVVKGGCMFGGACHAKGAVWQSDCIDYVCEEYKDSSVTKYYEKQTKIYCSDNNGTCHEMGKVIRHRCWDYECFVNGQYRGMTLVGGGCSHLGECRRSGEIWNQHCSNFTCKTFNNETYFKWSVEYLNPACELSNGTCIPEGTNLTIGCTLYQCRKNGLECGLIPIAGACATHNGNCVKIGGTFKLGCAVYQCNQYDKYIKLEPIVGGCSYNNTCYNVSERFNVSCKEYECQESNGIYQLKMINKGCLLGDGSCMKGGEIRQEGCYKKQCTVTSRSCRVEYVAADCRLYENGKQTCVALNTTIGEGCGKRKCVKSGDGVFDVKLEALVKACSYEGKCYEINKDFFHPHDANFCRKLHCMADGQASFKEMACRNSDGECIPIGSSDVFTMDIAMGSSTYRGECTCGPGATPACSNWRIV